MIKPKKSDVIVLLAIATIIFGGMHFLKHKRLDESNITATGYSPAPRR